MRSSSAQGSEPLLRQQRELAKSRNRPQGWPFATEAGGTNSSAVGFWVGSKSKRHKGSHKHGRHQGKHLEKATATWKILSIHGQNHQESFKMKQIINAGGKKHLISKSTLRTSFKALPPKKTSNTRFAWDPWHRPDLALAPREAFPAGKRRERQRCRGILREAFGWWWRNPRSLLDVLVEAKLVGKKLRLSLHIIKRYKVI